MTTGKVGVHRQIERLFSGGAAGGATDAQLLERYLDRRDRGAELAFETLIERHGAMVLRVCRTILGDPHDAQDAFQATFLVLARKAGDIREHKLLGNWLYGVACRTAMKARAGIARRRRYERQAAKTMMDAVEGDREHDDLGRVLHEEINRLPEGLRAPVVLCYLEGMTYEMASQHLRVTPSIVRGKLSRARNILRTRLISRGVVVASGLVLTTVCSRRAAAIPPGLLRSTAEAGLRYAAGSALAGGISGSVAKLAEGVLMSMKMGSLKKAAAIVLLVIGIAGPGVGVIAQQDVRGLRSAEPTVRSGVNPIGEVPGSGGSEERSGPVLESGAIAGDPISPPDRSRNQPGRRGGEENVKGEDADAPVGMSLDEAIARLLRENVDLRAKFSEIPQAQADILGAGLRANPIFYADGQLVPYGRYSRQRPGGQTQYDVTVSYPLDLSHKRQNRTNVATRAKRVLEAQYQDAVRLLIDNLYLAYIDVQAARQTVRSAQKRVQELDRVWTVARQLIENDKATWSDLNQVRIERESAQVNVLDSEEQLRKVKHTLAGLLNLPIAKAEVVELSLSILDHPSAPPSVASLIKIALENRPDLNAYRLQLRSSERDARVTQALQPRVTKLEQEVITDVQLASMEYETSRGAMRRIEHELLPHSEQVLKDSFRLYDRGEVNVVVHMNAQRVYNDTLAQYHGTLVRHRRSMLALNTVLGLRIMP